MIIINNTIIAPQLSIYNLYLLFLLLFKIISDGSNPDFWNPTELESNFKIFFESQTYPPLIFLPNRIDPWKFSSRIRTQYFFVSINWKIKCLNNFVTIVFKVLWNRM
jgi:hypothetical protein